MSSPFNSENQLLYRTNRAEAILKHEFKYVSDISATQTSTVYSQVTKMPDANTYAMFVKQHYHDVGGTTPQQRMKNVAALWRKSKSSAPKKTITGRKTK